MDKDIKQSMYRMPAEWEKHEAVWISWPYDKISFGSLNQGEAGINKERLPRVERAFLKVIDILKDSEEVRLLIRDRKKHLEISEKVQIIEADYADVWTRDYLPTFVEDKNGKLVAVNWVYDAYGEKFSALVKDNNVWSQINEKLKIETVEPGIILEAGAIDSNGQGMLLTTEQCLLTRNPNLNKTNIERIFAEFLGISKTIWLKNGLFNDHTDGHIDEVARFVSHNKIVCAYEDEKNDENYEILNDNYEVLRNTADTDGQSFEVIKLPTPHMFYADGNKAPASYCNFYIGNKVVLASIFNDPNDAKALEILQSLFPGRKVIGIDCRDIIYGGGAIHCLTQQQPE